MTKHPFAFSSSPPSSQTFTGTQMWCSEIYIRAHVHTHTHKPVEAAEGRTAHNNGWNGANGMAPNHVLDVFDTIPLILLNVYFFLPIYLLCEALDNLPCLCD